MQRTVTALLYPSSPMVIDPILAAHLGSELSSLNLMAASDQVFDQVDI